jgi:2-polyprenyl-6-methoxyphenol hydroxylase-like FAD-dependent oxidoreductase
VDRGRRRRRTARPRRWPRAAEHVQAVLDRLSPQPTTASHLRWSSVFRISHRLVDRYGVGRVFVAGDAAHIHLPTGAQGMNAGAQDAFNPRPEARAGRPRRCRRGVLDRYHAERHPVGERSPAAPSGDRRARWRGGRGHWDPWDSGAVRRSPTLSSIRTAGQIPGGSRAPVRRRARH